MRACDHGEGCNDEDACGEEEGCPEADTSLQGGRQDGGEGADVDTPVEDIVNPRNRYWKNIGRGVRIDHSRLDSEILPFGSTITRSPFARCSTRSRVHRYWSATSGETLHLMPPVPAATRIIPRSHPEKPVPNASERGVAAAVVTSRPMKYT